MVALFFISIPISEASVERSFSYQKFIQTPLRNKLSDAVVQATMFVRFNYLCFGDKALIPASFERARLLEALASEQEEEEENEEALLPAFLEQLAVEPSSST